MKDSQKKLARIPGRQRISRRRPGRSGAALDRVRRGIDRVDDEIVRQLAKRRTLVLELARIKRELDIPIFDRKREQALIERVRRWGKGHGLNEEFVEVLFRLIVMNSKETQYHEAL